MKAKITRCEEHCGENPEYPLVLLCRMSEGGMSFNLTYRLKIDNGLPKKMSGTVRFRSMSSLNPLDDEDADMYYMEAERKSIDFLVDYLRKEFPGTKISGAIKSTFNPLYNKQREYLIEV